MTETQTDIQPTPSGGVAGSVEDAIRRALDQVRLRITEAAWRAGRAPSEVTLVAVSKTFPAAAVQAAIAAGQRDFGENRVEEALPKIEAIGDCRSESELRWHLIGHLQSRKVKDAIGHFALIHSVDTVKLAETIDRRLANAQSPTPQSVLLECNASGEESKSGFAVAGWEKNPAVFDAFVRDVEEIVALPHVRVRGLMTMAPIVERPDQARPYFASLRALRDTLRERLPGVALDHLSMGMTDDFEAAIAEGATLVRIGRAIFGERG
jgi:pyridoxal phosphate enzyme (YggS family)